MNIALIGYGRMGQAIERIAAQRGHSIVLKITSANPEAFTTENLRGAAVAIEFTSPDAAPANVLRCLAAALPVVSGTTGWNDRLAEATALAQTSGAFLHASNFSVGVNIFFEINKLLARLMAGQSSYTAAIEEVHHFQKKDAPSGTAITLAQQIIVESSVLNSWQLSEDREAGKEGLPVTAIREEGVPGTHRVSWTSPVDTIEIIHTAHSRDGFALGAVLAAEAIAGRQGVFTMRDVLGFSS